MVDETITYPLISTKLHQPPVDRIHVHRPHLLERLDQRRSRPLTLVSAPAGYGKSVLIRSWLESCDDCFSCKKYIHCAIRRKRG